MKYIFVLLLAVISFTVKGQDAQAYYDKFYNSYDKYRGNRISTSKRAQLEITALNFYKDLYCTAVVDVNTVVRDSCLANINRILGTSYTTSDISCATGSGGSSVWGSITGTLSNQTDLTAALGAKADTSTVTTYTKGSNISLSGDTISVDLTGQPSSAVLYEAGDTISGQVVFTYNNTTFILTVPFINSQEINTDTTNYNGSLVYELTNELTLWDAVTGAKTLAQLSASSSVIAGNGMLISSDTAIWGRSETLTEDVAINGNSNTFDIGYTSLGSYNVDAIFANVGSTGADLNMNASSNKITFTTDSARITGKFAVTGESDFRDSVELSYITADPDVQWVLLSPTGRLGADSLAVASVGLTEPLVPIVIKVFDRENNEIKWGYTNSDDKDRYYEDYGFKDVYGRKDKPTKVIQKLVVGVENAFRYIFRLWIAFIGLIIWNIFLTIKLRKK